MSYEQLDCIADSYIPLLIVVTLFLLGRQSLAESFQKILGSVLALVASILFIYLLMFADQKLSLWSSAELDYSTHTALALCFVCLLSFRGASWFGFALISMILYCGLMLYQEYHTVADILTTSLAVLPVILALHLWQNRVNFPGFFWRS